MSPDHPSSGRQHQRQQQRENEAVDQTELAAAGETGSLEFATAEELLRHDAARTETPPGLASRVRRSVEADLPPRRSWWRRLLGR